MARAGFGFPSQQRARLLRRVGEERAFPAALGPERQLRRSNPARPRLLFRIGGAHPGNPPIEFRLSTQHSRFTARCEETFDQRNQTFETRSLVKLDEQLGRHRVTEQMNLINTHITNFVPLSEAINLPSTRTDSDSRYLMWGLHDIATVGNQGNPWLLNAYVQYRGEPFAARAAHPEASPATTLFNQFSGLTTGRLTGDLGQVKFGAGFTPLFVQPQYTSGGTHFDKLVQSHEIKF